MNNGGDGSLEDVPPSTMIGRVDMDAGVPPDSRGAAWSTQDVVVALLIILLMVGALTLILRTVFHVV